MEPTPIARPLILGKRTHVLEVIGGGIVGGMERVVQRLVERLPRERFAVTAVCPFESPAAQSLRALGVDVVIVPMPDDPPWPSVQTLCALVRELDIDVLHAHLQNAHALAGIVGSLTGRPVLATVHGRQLGMLDLEVQMAASTHISVVSRHSHLHALGVGIGASQLSLIPNGVDTEVFRPGARAVDGWRSRLRAQDTTPVIGFVGRLDHEKGPDVFVRAALLLRSALPEARFVMFGDGPMRGALETMVTRFGLGDRLTLVGVCDDMPSAYRELDLVVGTSHSEAMPLALMEAMASALPVVATRVGGVPDLIEPGANGWLAAPGDFQDIASRVAQVLQPPGERERMAGCARARAVERFDLDASVAATGRLLADLAARRTGTTSATATDAVAVTGPRTNRGAGSGFRK